MKFNYLLFAGATYYPGGGWDDFRGAYEELQHAVDAGQGALTQSNSGLIDWWHAVSIETGAIVERGRRQRGF